MCVQISNWSGICAGFLKLTLRFFSSMWDFFSSTQSCPVASRSAHSLLSSYSANLEFSLLPLQVCQNEVFYHGTCESERSSSVKKKATKLPFFFNRNGHLTTKDSFGFCLLLMAWRCLQIIFPLINLTRFYNCHLWEHLHDQLCHYNKPDIEMASFLKLHYQFAVIKNKMTFLYWFTI